MYCASWGDVEVVSYWSRDEEGDMYEGDVAMTLAGSDVLVDRLGV